MRWSTRLTHPRRRAPHPPHPAPRRCLGMGGSTETSIPRRGDRLGLAQREGGRGWTASAPLRSCAAASSALASGTTSRLATSAVAPSHNATAILVPGPSTRSFTRALLSPNALAQIHAMHVRVPNSHRKMSTAGAAGSAGPRSTRDCGDRLPIETGHFGELAERRAGSMGDTNHVVTNANLTRCPFRTQSDNRKRRTHLGVVSCSILRDR